MTQRDIERALWGIVADQFQALGASGWMEQAGWIPETAPPAEARRWSRAVERVSGILERHAEPQTQARQCHLLAGQMSFGEATR